MKKIGIIGSGDVGSALAKGFLANGYETTLSSR
ncbi:MAG: NAD(P)-binding domain-containing protein, partial [Bacteroidales bacterium]|nr:NAD(P)-binding domain-containing protein [Bacteroidales bacterium]